MLLCLASHAENAVTFAVPQSRLLSALITLPDQIFMSMQAVASDESGGTYTSLSAAPANYIAIHNMEVERYLSAALFGLASSSQGRDAIASSEAKIVRGSVP